MNRRARAARVVGRVLAVGLVGLSPLLWAGVAHAALPPGCTGAATAGPDVITCSDGVAAGQVIDSLGGDDRITVHGKVAGQIDAGGGDDTVTVTGRSADVVVERDGVSGAVRGGAGDDTLTVTGGAGTGTVNISGGQAVAEGGLVHGGDGDDTLTLAGGSGSPDVGAATAAGDGVWGEVRGGAGADGVTVRGGNGGPGADGGDGVVGADGVFTGAVHGGDPGLDTPLDAGDGADTIEVFGGDGGVGASGGETGSSGSSGSAVAGMVSGGARGDTITATGGNGAANSGIGNAGFAGSAVAPAGVVAGGDPVPGLLDFEAGDTLTLTGGNGGTNASSIFPDRPGGIALAGTVRGDGGDDRLFVTGGNGSSSSEAGPAAVGFSDIPSDIPDTVEGGAGADRIALSLGEGTTDNVYAVQGAGIRGGGQMLDGDDTVTVGTAGQPDRGTSLNARFAGDAGDDTLTLHGRAVMVGVDGGDGDDTCGRASSGADFGDCETVTD
ncbi:hypothetical protein ACIBK8_33180 [Streptomyces sp. NPDC050161]|uniref:hypothetical protein n=1 Tax=Streptomyces sp. NPDC050161 TaxID=3365604 RepID=UPI0037A07F91